MDSLYQEADSSKLPNFYKSRKNQTIDKEKNFTNFLLNKSPCKNDFKLFKKVEIFLSWNVLICDPV